MNVNKFWKHVGWEDQEDGRRSEREKHEDLGGEGKELWVMAF